MKEEETVKKTEKDFFIFPDYFSFPLPRGFRFKLKILFHKNKEIERMLSKKMTFSLMSLITLLALAFVVSSAMAAEFAVKFEGRTALTYVEGGGGDSNLGYNENHDR